MFFAVNFLIQVVQQLMLALGVALAGANLFALVRSWWLQRKYKVELAGWQVGREGQQQSVGSTVRSKPQAPATLRKAPSVVNVVIGMAIALVALASLTYGWL